MKVSDLIYAAFRILGVLQAAGRTSGQAEKTDAFNQLNTMIEAWQLERLMVYETLREIFTITSIKQTYTVGPGGDFDIPVRPGKIYPVGYVDGQGTETPLAQFTTAQWAETPLKSTTSTRPQAYYYQPSVPLANMSFYPVPSAGGSIAAYVWHTVDQFTSVDQDVLLPAGYAKAIEYNLAVEIAPMFPRAALSQAAVEIAIDSKAWVKSFNSSSVNKVMGTDPALACCGAYNIYTDTF